MNRTIATILSIIFHPMLMPLFGLFLIFNSGTHLSFLPVQVTLLIYFIVFVSTCILPLSILPLLAQFKLIRSFKMESHRERILPIFITGFFFVIGYFVLQKFKLPLFVYQFMLASLISLNLALIITFFWKISLHMAGISGVIGGLLILSIKFGLGISPFLLIAIVAAGFVASARLYLNAHNPSQIFVGFAIGFIPMIIIPFL